MSYSIESITESIGARRVGNVPATIDWLLTDSRSLNFPEETLFFALTTKRNDGARYIADLYARGVRNFVLSEESFRLIEHGELKIDNDAQQPAIHFQSFTVNYPTVSSSGTSRIWRMVVFNVLTLFIMELSMGLTP